MKGVTIEPTGISEKSEPQMGFEHSSTRIVLATKISVSPGVNEETTSHKQKWRLTNAIFQKSGVFKTYRFFDDWSL